MELWRLTSTLLATATLAAAAAPCLAELPAAELPAAELPPALPWQGASLALALPPESGDPWITPAERDGLLRTPDYDETVAWLRRLVAAAAELEMVSLGVSGEGRELWMVIASAAGASTPAALARSGKPVVLVQAGIHAGEIDGKDAGLMLLRDLTVGGTSRPLLDRVELLFVPIFNVDGHERSSELGRINQRGPQPMGWRTNARNLNLNRDYAKADSREMQALLGALAAWQPDLYVDVHVTDGIDYQYDITWGYGGEHTYSPSISRWLAAVLDPPVRRALTAMGHFPGYLVFAVDGENPDGSLFKWSAASLRYSDGYGNARHLPTILVENHALKPYPQRVLGTYVFLKAVLAAVGENHATLARAIAEDRARRSPQVILSWQVAEGEPAEEVEFLGVTWRHRWSAVTGTEQVEWLGEPVTKTLERVEATRPAIRVKRPAAYWIPGAWSGVIDRLALHGIAMERLESAREVEVDMYRLTAAKLASTPYEGRVRAELEQPPQVERRLQRYPPGSVRIPTDQPLGDLAVLLLEPQAQDSFFQWGFFHGIASRTEYVEGYVMEPLAARMLATDPELRTEFEKKLRDEPDFAADPRARLAWFYRRTPFFDDRWQLYPVGRETAAAR
ncbi:MAG: M14 family metallopeptidase [Thermoanaerobaculia bacterium]